MQVHRHTHKHTHPPSLVGSCSHSCWHVYMGWLGEGSAYARSISMLLLQSASGLIHNRSISLSLHLLFSSLHIPPSTSSSLSSYSSISLWPAIWYVSINPSFTYFLCLSSLCLCATPHLFVHIPISLSPSFSNQSYVTSSELLASLSFCLSLVLNRFNQMQSVCFYQVGTAFWHCIKKEDLVSARMSKQTQ